MSGDSVSPSCPDTQTPPPLPGQPYTSLQTALFPEDLLSNVFARGLTEAPASQVPEKRHVCITNDGRTNTARSETDMTAALEAIGCSEEGKQPPVILLITSPPIVEEQYEW